jgi:uncharacterized repeat protein (TIGR01451 family)
MKIFSNIKRSSAKLLVVGLLLAAVAGFGIFKSVSADVVISTPTDCDTNAVMFCGATSLSTLQSKYANGDGKSTTTSIHNIFSFFGISSSDVASMQNTTVAGTVTKSGDVIVNGEVVATGAVTAGRSFITGSTKVSYGGTTFYTRAPSVSFVSNSLSAYVIMVNGKFSHAVLASCGNPVNATPKTPNFSIVKNVRVKGQTVWQKNVSVLSTTHVEYRVTVSSTGQIAARNIVARDTLPANVTYVANTLMRDGVAVSAASSFFGSTGNAITSLSPGKAVVYTFEAIVGAKDTVDSCTPKTLVNTGFIAAPGLPNKNDTANVNENCAPKPVFSCDTFDFTKGDNRTITVSKFEKTAIGGATFTNLVVDWGDTTTDTLKDNEVIGKIHTFTTDNTFIVVATAHFMVNGQDVSHSGSCTKPVTLTAAPVTPPTTPPTTPPSTPEVLALPDTGAGSVIGMFFGASIASGIVYRWYLLRRTSQI